MKWITEKSGHWKNTGEALKYDRKNFPLGDREKKTNNESLAKALKALMTQCKRDKLTLYFEGVDENGMEVYKIHEKPTFVARFYAAERASS